MNTSPDKSTINRLKQLPRLFRKQDAQKIAPHANIFLSRAAKKGYIHRINRGSYINSFLKGFPSVETVACFVRPPAYISCEWALNAYGITLQSPMVCTCITLSGSVGKNRTIQYNGITIEFSKIKPELFCHFQFHDSYHIALPEKAILDTIYYRGAIVAMDELEWDEVDFDLLFEMQRYYPLTVQKKIQEMKMFFLNEY
jgi:hypothetical protein